MKLNIAVIFGGRSVEHEISVLSAQQFIAALDKEKYQVIPLYIAKSGSWYTGNKLFELKNYRDLDKLLTQCRKVIIDQNAGSGKIYSERAGLFRQRKIVTIDVAVPITHGTNGEDGVLQGMLETMNIPYVGCDVLASALTMDKISTKMWLQNLCVPVLDYAWFYSHEWIENRDVIYEIIHKRFKYPLIVKPANLGSSVGVSAVHNDSELENAIDLAVSMSHRILIEPMISNLREINCAVLGDRENVEVSLCEEPIRADAILSYQDKYLSGAKGKGPKVGAVKGMSSAKRKIPADLPENLSKEIQAVAKKVFINMNCCGVTRIDLLIDCDTDKVYLCELNTIPGSMSFYLWEPLGKSFSQLADQLIELALKRHRQNKNLVLTYSANILQSY